MSALQSSLYNDAFNRAAWLEEGTELLLSAMSSQWTIGDWALRIPAEASRDEVRELLEEAGQKTGYDVNTLRDLRTVAERIPPTLRKPSLSWYAHKEISKLSASDAGKASEEKSLALRSEFLEKFAADPEAKVLAVRSAVRAQMNKPSSRQETVTISFKLSKCDYVKLEQIAKTNDSVADFVYQIVLARIAEAGQL
jgi:uncharacterized membrane protein